MMWFPVQTQVDSPFLTQIVEPSLKTMSVAIVAKLQDLNVRDLQLLRVGLAALANGSDVYPVGTLRIITEGRGIHTYLTRDAAIVSFTTPADVKADPVQVLISLMKEPILTEDSISATIEGLQKQSSDYWRNQVNPNPFVLTTASKEDILGAFHRTFRLDRMRIGKLGPAASNQSDSAWNSAVTDWTPPVDAILIDDPVVPAVVENESRVSTGEFIGASIDPADANLSADILALYALGIGKCSSLYRISREKHGWSYRQESFLYGSPSGFEPHLFIAMKPDVKNPERLSSLSDELRADVGSWNDDTLQQSIGMAEANLLRRVPYGPFILADQALGEDPEQRLDFELYWKGKTGHEWSSESMMQSLRKVDLTALKDCGQKILQSSRSHYLPAAH